MVKNLFKIILAITFLINAGGCCETNEDCDDGLFCNGTETCVNKTCRAGTAPCPPDISTCNEISDTCDRIPLSDY
jgi:hypothetical protein